VPLPFDRTIVSGVAISAGLLLATADG